LYTFFKKLLFNHCVASYFYIELPISEAGFMHDHLLFLLPTVVHYNVDCEIIFRGSGDELLCWYQGKCETYEFLSGVPITPSTQFVSLRNPDTRSLFTRAIHFIRYCITAHHWSQTKADGSVDSVEGRMGRPCAEMSKAEW